ncbi:hypothetical protein ACVW1C_005808 [Bradyrhizobium sp. USDA 4011]
MDDWRTHTLNDPPRLDLPEIFEERYKRKSTLITAQAACCAMARQGGESAIADAILDRIIHNAHCIALEGDSVRKKKLRLTSAENSEPILSKIRQPSPLQHHCPQFSETAVPWLSKPLSGFREIRN